MKCRKTVLFALFACLAMSSVAVAKDDLMVSFVQYTRGHYAAPPGNTIVVSDRPYPFYVLVKNTADRATAIYEKKGPLSEEHLEFEFTDSKGAKTVIKHKNAPTSRERGGYRMMQPDEHQIASVMLHPGEWTPKLPVPADKDSEWTLRIVYVNGKNRVSSVPYKVTVKAIE